MVNSQKMVAVKRINRQSFAFGRRPSTISRRRRSNAFKSSVGSGTDDDVEPKSCYSK